MKQLIIDRNTCIGCGLCVTLCPQVFKLGEDGKAEVINQSADTPSNIQNAIDSCPVGVIKWEEK